MTTYVESFTTGWHIQSRQIHRPGVFASETECGLTFIPRNLREGGTITPVCVECRRYHLIRTGDTSYISLRSIDVGFDARLQEMAIKLPDGDDLSVDTDQCLYGGPRAEVIREMERDGWIVSAE